VRGDMQQQQHEHATCLPALPNGASCPPAGASVSCKKHQSQAGLNGTGFGVSFDCHSTSNPCFSFTDPMNTPRLT
jgi:hypothetical protein